MEAYAARDRKYTPAESVAPPGGIVVQEPAPTLPTQAPAHASPSASSSSAQPGASGKECSVCHQVWPATAFSANQLSKGRHRRCKSCIDEVKSRQVPHGSESDAEQEEGRIPKVSHVRHEDEDQEYDVTHVDGQPNAFERRFNIHTKAPGLFNSIAFPRWQTITDENDPSLVYYTDPYKYGEYRPLRYWTLLAQIHDCSMVGMGFGRNTLFVRDRDGAKFPVAFYADQPIDIRPLMNSSGHTIAVRFAEQHGFMDGSVGVRIEDLKYVQVIPCSLDQLYASYEEVHLKGLTCWTCRKTATASAASAMPSSSTTTCTSSGALRLSICAACHMARYCSRTCQEQDWQGGHKSACKILRHVHDLLGVPVEAPKPVPRRLEFTEFSIHNLIKT